MAWLPQGRGNGLLDVPTPPSGFTQREGGGYVLQLKDKTPPSLRTAQLLVLVLVSCLLFAWVVTVFTK